MAKDQLGWEHLLNSDAEKTAEPAASPAVVESSAEPKTRPTSEGRATKSKTRKSTKPAAPLASEPASYAKQDWSALAPVAPKAVVREVVEVKVETTASVVREAREENVVRERPSSSSREKASRIATDVSEAAAEPQVISVSDLNRHIRDILEGKFSLVWLKGEISNFKSHTSGHFYFSLKDAKAQISAVMFRGYNSQLRFAPEDGMEVLVRGKITVYEPRGNYQIFCETMEPVGAGALQKAFEQLKEKLRREGMFDEARKRALPALPKHIAIVTSPTGAAIRDMLNVLGRRYRGAQITVVPCKVQGDQAPGEIVAAIALAQRLSDVDVMIVGRGGGSIEDLWAFNDERVARAISQARVPVISAVGHEIDFTIADFVADLRAPTPSAAAELVVKNAGDLRDRVNSLARALRVSMLAILSGARQIVTSTSRRLVDPQRSIQNAIQRCDELMQRLQNGTRISFIRKRDALTKHMAVLDSLSPLRVLDRGYSMVVDHNDRIITNASDLREGQMVNVRLREGEIEAEVKKILKK